MIRMFGSSIRYLNRFLTGEEEKDISLYRDFNIHRQKEEIIDIHDDSDDTEASNSYNSYDNSNDSNEQTTEYDDIEYSLIEDLNNTFGYPKDHIHIIYRLFKNEFDSIDTIDKSNRLNYLFIQKKEHNIKETGVYRSIYYLDIFKHHLPSEPCRTAGPILDTFIVSKKLDFLCTHVIENALLSSIKDDKNSDIDKELLDNNCRDLFICRKKGLCLPTHPSDSMTNKKNKISPNNYVIYTKIDSDFYQFCKKVLSSNEYFDFESGSSDLNIQYISFYVVLFLCGKSIEFNIERPNSFENPSKYKIEEEKSYDTKRRYNSDKQEEYIDMMAHINSLMYKDTNQWIRVPYWFILIWDASHTDHVH